MGLVKRWNVLGFMELWRAVMCKCERKNNMVFASLYLSFGYFYKFGKLLKLCNTF